MIEYKVGMLVEHPGQPDWGPGTILDIQGRTLTIRFRDIPERHVGEAVKKFSLDCAALLLAPNQTDPLLANLPEIKKGRIVQARWTLDDAIATFLRTFPMGFRDAKYIGAESKRGERAFKLRASEDFNATLGNGLGERLLKDGSIDQSALPPGHPFAAHLICYIGLR